MVNTHGRYYYYKTPRTAVLIHNRSPRPDSLVTDDLDLAVSNSTWLYMTVHDGTQYFMVVHNSTRTCRGSYLAVLPDTVDVVIPELRRATKM